MAVQFHPLFPGGEILPLGEAARHHGIGLEHHVVFKSVFNQLSLHPQDGANLHTFNNGLCLLGFQEAADPDGIVVPEVSSYLAEYHWNRIRGKFYILRQIEIVDRFDQADAPDLEQVIHVLTAA